MFTTIRWQQRFQNFEKAYKRLLDAIDRVGKTPDDQLLAAGLIQTYEFTMELGWKTMKDFLVDKGFDLSGSKDVMRQALQEGFIVDARIWLEAIDARNETAHIYDEQKAKEIVDAITLKYREMLTEVYEFFKKEYNAG